MVDPTISVVLNAHREGTIIEPTLLNLDQAVEQAERLGVHVEVIVMLDRPDTITRELVEAYAAKRAGLSIQCCNHGDLGLARNEGVETARGKWVAFLDGDDLWCADWLVRAYNAAESDPRLVVWHPEVNVYFGVRRCVFKHVDMEEACFDEVFLALTNYWTALCFAPRSLLIQVPYERVDHVHRVGFEDWGWNLAVIRQGALHKVVPNTGHAIRSKATSLLQQTEAAGYMPQHGDFFRHLVDRRAAKLTEDDSNITR